MPRDDPFREIREGIAASYPVNAYCETCGRLFHNAVPGKFCDVPTCRGYLRHIDRGHHGVERPNPPFAVLGNAVDLAQDFCRFFANSDDSPGSFDSLAEFAFQLRGALDEALEEIHADA